MKVVVAPDSFKESLSALQVARAIAGGWLEAWPGCEMRLYPMADGGEGTVDALLAATKGERRTLEVCGPLGERLQAHWGWLGDGRAVVEIAAASGLHRLPNAQRDPTLTTSYGTGQLIRAALDAGATQIILGLGGSATNDAGAGLLQALGASLRDAGDRELAPGGEALMALQRIDLSGLDPRLGRVRLQVASDVDNPLCGPRGASVVFGPQKGASPAQVELLDRALGHFADVLSDTLGKDEREIPGAGAAGGVGFATRAVLGTDCRPGIEVVAELSGLAEAMQGADLVITGEGRLDAQTLHGKTPAGVARIARAAGVPVIALAGSLGEGYQALYEIGIDAAFSLTPGPMTLDQALATAEVQLRQRAGDIARLWRLPRCSVEP